MSRPMNDAVLAKQIIAKDPAWCMGEHYMSAVAPGPEGQAHLDKALALSKAGSPGERRFVDILYRGRANQGADFPKVVPELEQLAADFPKERLVRVILGQIHQNGGEPAKARKVFEEAETIGPPKDPFHTLLLARAYEKLGDKENAQKTWRAVTESQQNGLERALAFPEAKRKLASA